MLGIGLSLTSLLRSSVADFSPASIFSSNEPGLWLDPSDVANLAWRRNLLTFTEQFDNAAWASGYTGSITRTPNTIAAPDGTVTADTLTATASTGRVIQQAVLATSSSTYTFSVWLKRKTGTGQLRIYANYDAIAYKIVTEDITDWTRVSYTYTGSALWPGVWISSSGDEVYAWGAQLELGSVATDYQRITDVNTEVIERFPSATLYQDTQGTTPVTSPAQTVALALDKSRGLALGPELVTNGDFSAGSTGWTVGGTGVTITGGVANFNVTSFGGLVSTGSLASGLAYRVSITVSNFTSGSLLIFGSGGAAAARFFVPASNGTHVGYITASGAGNIQIIGNPSFVGTIDNISVNELPGFHATQATLASRPTYGIVPLGGRRNVFERSEEFDNAYWSKDGATVPATNNTAPNGTATAETLTETATTGVHGTYRVPAGAFAAGTYTLSCYLKQGTARYAHLLLNTSVGYSAATFDLQDGLVTKNQTGGTGVTSPASPTIVSVGSGWYRATITATTNATMNAAGPLISNSGTPTYTATGGVSYAGNTANNILIWGAQLETGSSATNYQRVGSAFDVTEAGVASLSYLSFDGVDDSLVTPTITPGIDRAQVFAGVRKLSDAAAGIVVESSAAVGSNAGSFYLTAPDTSPTRYASASRGNASILAGHAATTTTGDAPDTAVIAATHDIPGDLSTIRRNTVSGTSGTADKGSGIFQAYPLYIGRRAGTSLALNGNLFSLIVRFGTNLDAGTITSTETWVGGKTGVTL